MISRWHSRVREMLARHWRRVLLLSLGGLAVPLMVAQFLYPSNTLLPFSAVEGFDLSGWNKEAAARALDNQYLEAPINIFFGADSTEVYTTVKPTDLGITVSNEQRFARVDYPWYLRLVPGSLFWGHFVVGASDSPSYNRDSAKLTDFIKGEWGNSCSAQPLDASLEVVGGSIVVENGHVGGTCNLGDVTRALASVRPTLTSNIKVIVPADIIPVTITNAQAEQLAVDINKRIESGIKLTAGESKVLLPRDQLISWLDFTATEGKLDFSFNIDRANDYLNEQLATEVARNPGVTIISTNDFVEISRQTGQSGRTLDVATTLTNLKDYVAGKVDQPSVGLFTSDPSIKYDRSYSQTNDGLSSLISNFAATHAGTYGVALTELSGQYRRATYNSTKSFITASTYKLFVAYSTLRRIEAGTWQWTDQIQGGRNLTKCFDDMIVLSNNECARALLNKIGFTTITDEAHAIGCVNTSFLGSGGIKSTPEDLALLLAELQTGQILSQQSSRDTLINAMKRNVYRRGIPAGETGIVADKVGFLDALLHDAAIVYSSTGPYVLVIMTDGSSWSNIADLTHQIEALRVQ